MRFQFHDVVSTSNALSPSSKSSLMALCKRHTIYTSNLLSSHLVLHSPPPSPSDLTPPSPHSSPMYSSRCPQPTQRDY
ncbi:hypothetical protein EYC84_006501 [Monilinia fructicola]|uniref:Uncharacterized protein n=1 Tax=Monilinia fructicola TaxID=38448 RepID=A0A5M9K3J4_MONFR|nr:hypothetical protein EYC84_006501 [Monilinia fructicola]